MGCSAVLAPRDLGRRGFAYPVWQIGLAGETPLNVLRRGSRDAVVQAARLYGEEVAA